MTTDQMLRHISIRYLLLVLSVSILSCGHSDRFSSERLLFNVEAGIGLDEYETFRLISQGEDKHLIEAPAAAFDSVGLETGSGVIPSRLVITFDQEGDLVPSLLRPLGYKVLTRIEFDDDASTINVSHTNIADSLLVAEGDSLADTLYVAVRGEGLVSGGEGVFENATGFFFEQSTYRIVHDTLIANISCHYELSVEY